MQRDLLRISLTFSGSISDENRIDLYDVSQALIGFQRSIALTTHLVLNQEIITQSPSLKGARIIAIPPEAGSWKMVAIVALAAYHAGTAENNSPLGHLIFSVYDYVISESIGVHVDYNKSLLQLYEEANNKNIDIPNIRQSQADALVEKCARAVYDIHRPIYKTRSSDQAVIDAVIGSSHSKIGTNLSMDTWEYMHETMISDQSITLTGRISSYNTNTYKGRIYVDRYGRPVPFELEKDMRDERVVQAITTSLQSNALRSFSSQEDGSVHFRAREQTSRSGQIKSLLITDISEDEL